MTVNNRIFRALNPMAIFRYVNDVRSNATRVSELYGVPVRHIVRDQIALFLKNELRRDEFYRYHLFDPNLTWEDKRAFISDKELRRIQRHISSSEYLALFKNKLLFKNFVTVQVCDLPKMGEGGRIPDINC